MLDPVQKIMASNAGKTASETIGKMGGSFLGDILQYSEWGINQRLRMLENQIDAVNRVKKRCEEKNFPMKQVKLNVLLPYLEGVAVEEEPELQQLWTNLMVNYLDESKNLTTHVYPNILKQLSSKDVEFLKSILNKGYIDMRKHIVFNVSTFVDEGVANLVRLGLVEHEKLYRTAPTSVAS